LVGIDENGTNMITISKADNDAEPTRILLFKVLPFEPSRGTLVDMDV